MKDMDEKIVNKIRKLLALSKSTNENEAKLAAEKASDLMEKYQIEMAEVLLKDNEKIIKDYYFTHDGRRKWYVTLASGCAILFDGTAAYTPHGSNADFIFIGHPDDIQMMKNLFEHLYESWKSIVEFDWNRIKYDSDIKKMEFKSDHGNAYARVIRHRCEELVQKRKKAVVSSSVSGSALIHLKDKQLQVFCEVIGLKTMSINGRLSEGSIFGAEAGKNASLSGAIDKSSRKQLSS